MGAASPISEDEFLVEQTHKTQYNHRPPDIIPNLIAKIRPHLWTTVLSTPPYRHYYLYACPDGDEGELLPQLLSMYALMYYLGSITRYRPQWHILLKN